MKNKIIPLLNKLQFSIYVVGYNNLGESILFTLENDFGICYCGVVDSYENDNINKTIELLESLKIKNINLLVWTHPHVDHTLGISKIIDKYTNEETRIVYPQGVYDVNSKNDYIREVAEKIKNIVLSQKRKKPIMLGVRGSTNLYRTQIGNRVGQSYKFEIITLSPIHELVDKRQLTGNFTRPNDYSISILISIGEINIFFGSDIQDISIAKIDEMFLPYKIDYVKIPHHGSADSQKLLEWFDKFNKSNISCTTEYTTGNLPRKEILERYKACFNEVYVIDKTKDKGNYGMIKTVYDVLGKSFCTVLEGNTEVYHKEEISDNNNLLQKL